MTQRPRQLRQLGAPRAPHEHNGLRRGELPRGNPPPRERSEPGAHHRALNVSRLNASRRVAAGEQIVVTRDARRVAELTTVRPVRLSRDALLERWRHLPRVDAQRLRRNLDTILDADA